MRIHSVELRNVRQFKELVLDLSAPLTVIGGPNGVGKTTLQEAILAAMFLTPKELRDSFVSQFDTGSPPTVVLGLSHGDNAAAIMLTRCLADDKGQWQEGATTLKRKRQALDKIQELLPLSAEAAALLLWGRQDDLSRVVEAFPSDGHTLLTAATIRGSGPDPKDIIKELEKDLDNARKGERGGQVVGALTRAEKRVKALEEELDNATAADEQLSKLREQLDKAKTERDQIKSQQQELEARVEQLDGLEKLLKAALADSAKLVQLVAQQTDWAEQEEQIDTAKKTAASLESEVQHLQLQYRVARDQELGREIDKVREQLKTGEVLEAECTTLDRDLKSRKRPEPLDVQTLEKLQRRLDQTQAKIEANGVRYELAATGEPRTLRVAEDGKPDQEVTLAPGQVHTGIVGRLVIDVDGLRFTATGKEDIAGLKDVVDKASQEIGNLFAKFQVDNQTAFRRLAKEKQLLREALENKHQELRLQLGGSNLADLRLHLERLLAARGENNVSLQDQEACAGQHLLPAGELKVKWSRTSAVLEAGQENLAGLESKRPSEAEKTLHKGTLEKVRAKADRSAAAFTEADPNHREPTRGLDDENRSLLATARLDKDRVDKALVRAEKVVADLAGQLKQTQPQRPLADIQSDLEEARQSLHREQALQEARALLRDRIQEKMQALAGHVPVELGKRVTRHLARLMGGRYHEVFLGQGLAVSHIAENGALQPWQLRQLSHGERHQAAVAVKIAVARALAETSGPVFIILDDSLVTFDPQRRAATEELLLDLAADKKLQAILLTCHTDWAAGWKARRPDQVHYIELAKSARYYRDPPALAALSQCESSFEAAAPERSPSLATRD
jgi:DNA repair exonuclease SbcCD ATPase subunit